MFARARSSPAWSLSRREPIAAASTCYDFPGMIRASRAARSLVTVWKLFVGSTTAYLGLLTVSAWCAGGLGRDRTPTRSAPSTRFAVLVPAHDEELLIGATVTALVSQRYPRDLFEVYVVADNCTDATAEIAARHGATVHRRSAPERPGKGPALSWLIDQLNEERFDAVVVVDADTTTGPNLLEVFDARLGEGANAVQAYYAVRDDDTGGDNVAIRSAALAARHYVRPLGRRLIGGSSGLYGNGMAFRREIIERRRLSDHLTEDLELQIDLLLDGDVVDFAPDARIEAEMPTDLASSRSQHERWERGRQDVARRLLPRLIRQMVRRGTRNRIALIDSALDVATPPLSVLTGAIAITAVGAAARSSTDRRRRRAFWTIGAPLTLVFHVLSALVMTRAPRAVWLSLLGAPRLILWKLALWLRVAMRSDVSWVRTARNIA